MEEYKFKEVDHPLFGKIITTQGEASNILYKSHRSSKSYRLRSFRSTAEWKVDFEVITMKIRNPLGYIIRKKVRFISEKGIREMISRLGQLETKNVVARQKRYIKLLQQ
jgi:hypothetical protein